MATYATVDEVKLDIGLRDESNVDLATLERTIEAAERSINRFCGRPDGFISDSSATARYYVGRGLPWIMIDECTSITTVAVKGSATATTYTDWTSPSSDLAGDGDWIPFTYDPRTPDFNASARGRPYTFLAIDINGSYSIFTDGFFSGRPGFRPTVSAPRAIPTVKVTAKWGFATSIPGDIKLATIMQAARWYKRLSGAMGDSLANPEFGRVTYIQELDPDVKHLLYGGRYIRPVI